MRKFRRKKKKNHRAPHWPGGTPPPQRLKLFFSLECGSKLFSQPLQRATTSPQSLGSAGGVEPSGRGAYVTQHTQEANQWGEKMHSERGRRVCSWKVFSARRRGSSLCERDDEWKRKAKGEGVKKIYTYMPCLLSGLEAGGMCLNALGLLPKKPFSDNIKRPQPTARFRQKFYRDSLLSCTHNTKELFFFCLQLHDRLYVFFRFPIS